jgi:iron complex transport system substrate-binding protein
MTGRDRIMVRLAPLLLFLGVVLSVSAADAQQRPQRIVSMNLCTDELLMRMVDPSRIAAITHL